MAMYLCQEVGGLRLTAIAEQFGLAGYPGAGSAVRTFRQRLSSDVQLAPATRQVVRGLGRKQVHLYKTRLDHDSFAVFDHLKCGTR